MAAKTAAKPAAAEVHALVAAYFCRLADAIGLPRSVAQIYAILFLAPEPLSFGEIVVAGGLSKASASTGLRHLRRLRGVEVVVRPAERRTYYRPETSLRRLVSGFLAETLKPGLADGDRLLAEAARVAAADSMPDHVRSRLTSLRAWHQRADDLLPALNIFGSS
jgi:DNA-binding transcriptional regulator GbsR (MarR family)